MYFENFIFHNLQIGVNWCVEWGTYWNVHTRKHSPCKKFNSKIYHEFADNKQTFVNVRVWKYYTSMENFGGDVRKCQIECLCNTMNNYALSHVKVLNFSA